MSKTNKMTDLLVQDDQTKTLPTEEIPNVDTEIPPLATPKPPSLQSIIAPDGPRPSPQKLTDLRGKRIAQTEKLYSSLGISRKFVPPLTRKRSAIYQLYNFKGKKDKRMMEPMDQFVDPHPYQLVPSYTFIDTEETDLSRREKTMTYYEGGTELVYVTDPVTKKPVAQSIQKVGSPEFIGGQVVVNIFDAFQRFVWWELHPRNASNKWRDKSKEPIFERIDTKFESPHVSNIKMDLRMDAERYVLGLKTDGLINLAAALSNPTVNTNVDPQTLKLTLRMRAQQNPEEILFRAPDNIASVKVATIHALDLGIISYIPEHESYYFGNDESVMFQVPFGNPPFDALVGFLSGPDGAENYKEIKTQLDFWF